MLDPFVIARPFASRLKRRLRRWRANRVDYGAMVADLDPTTISQEAAVTFQCNLCGSRNSTALAQLSREAESCSACGSNVRLRALARLVVREVLDLDVALHELPTRRDVTGLGLSDAIPIAHPLKEKFSYENTWFHAAPKLNIANVSPERFGRYDFVVASEVFEHVAPPISRAFDNARRLLKPGGKFIFTVPFSLEPDTLEHFPELHDWTMAKRNGLWQLTNTTLAGQRQSFDNLIFHGGPGTTLEMRLFSRAGLQREFARAGFAHVREAGESYLPFGIHWPKPFSVPMVAYAS
jgi:SAM-dependent methyltransferase